MLTDIMNHHMLDVITDQRVIRWLEILYSLATRTPRIVLDRVEETLPTLRRSMVSVVMAFVIVESNFESFTFPTGSK